jgi:hypothetical protein
VSEQEMNPQLPPHMLERLHAQARGTAGKMEEGPSSQMPPPSPASAHGSPSMIAGFGHLTRRKNRIPMSVPAQRLEVQTIPGWRLYWFKEENVARAYCDSHYEFVTNEEVALNRISIAGNPRESGNTDLGSGVSIIGGTTQSGTPQRLVLMKLPMELFKEDQALLMQKGVERLSGVFEGEKIFGEDGEINDAGQLTYTKDTSFRSKGTFVPLMNRPVRKAKVGRGGRL